MHRVVINFGCARQVGRTTAMLAIFESIIENIKVRDLKHVSTIIYVTRREDDANELTRKIKPEVEVIRFVESRKLYGDLVVCHLGSLDSVLRFLFI